MKLYMKLFLSTLTIEGCSSVLKVSYVYYIIVQTTQIFVGKLSVSDPVIQF